MSVLPTFFISHGSPMHAVEPGDAADAWRALAASIPRPRAILIASAHWETGLPMLTGRDRLETIHDFSGFPDELYRIRYDAPGAPEVASRALALLRDAGYTAAIDGCRGIDHGAWVPLRYMYPDRDVPVAQISVQPALGTAHHLRLGEALAPLADEGVLVIGSGHVTHNLRDWFASRHDAARARLRAEVRAVAQRADRRRTTARRCSTIASERRRGRGRIRPRNISCRSSSHGAQRAPGARATRVLASVDGGALAMDAYRFDRVALRGAREPGRLRRGVAGLSAAIARRQVHRDREQRHAPDDDGARRQVRHHRHREPDHVARDAERLGRARAARGAHDGMSLPPAR